MADEWVHIRHPEVDAPSAPVERRAFESSWKPLGWEIVDDTVAEASALAGHPVTGLDDLTREQLNDLAASKGVDVSDAKTKADVVTAIDRAGR